MTTFAVGNFKISPFQNMRVIVLKILGLIIHLNMASTVCAQKTDKVLLRNGDEITGEIKNLKFAILSFSTDGPGTLSIKWEHVIKITTDKTFQVTLRQGDVLVTRLDSAFLNQSHLMLNDIVEIVRIKDKFLQRMSGDANLGFNYAKANNTLQFNLNSAFTYRKPKMEVNLKLNSVITDNSIDSITSKKQDVTTDLYRKLNNNFYLNGLLGWQQNTQLGLKNRVLLSLAGGKVLLSNNRRRLLTGGGLTYNVEQSTGSESGTNNLEGLLAIQYKEFQYSSPKISITTGLALYPGLSDWGRLRMDLQINLRIEIFKDFNVGLSFYEAYDNRPPNGNASKSDFGINFSIGYEFGK